MTMLLIGCEKTAPLKITSPLDGSQVSKIVTISVVTPKDRKIDVVELLIDGQPIGIKDYTPDPFELQWNTTAYEDGSSHQLSVRAFDERDEVIMSTPITVIVYTELKHGLIGYYPFDGNAHDESGNQSHGTVIGATLTEDRNGNENSAYSFNGSSDYIRIDAYTHYDKLVSADFLSYG